MVCGGTGAPAVCGGRLEKAQPGLPLTQQRPTWLSKDLLIKEVLETLQFTQMPAEQFLLACGAP